MNRARHERGRPRTRDRALLTLQRLADALSAPGPPPPADRLRLAFVVAQPLGLTLKKELGEGLIASGLVGKRTCCWRMWILQCNVSAVGHPLSKALRNEL